MKIKRKLKKMYKSKFIINLVGFLIALYIRLLRLSMNTKIVGFEHFLAANKGGEQSIIFCLWHGRLMMMPTLVPKTHKLNVIASRHTDGQLLSGIQKNFNIGTIAGSTSKGGTSAIREILRAVERKELIGITPDGPRGPARKVGGLSIEIAKKLDIPIIPVTFSCSRYKTIQSWDSLMIPKLFSKGIFMIGEAKKFESAEALESALNQLTDEADRAFTTL
jgi:hypothetical protein